MNRDYNEDEILDDEEEAILEEDTNPGGLVPQTLEDGGLEMVPDGAEDQQALRILAELRESFQRSRIAFGNRIAAIERGSDTASPLVKEVYRLWGNRFLRIEKDAEEQLLSLAANFQIIEDMTAIRGMGALTAAKIVSQIDIAKAKTVSALWRYSGYGAGEYWADANGRLVSPVQGTHWVTKGGQKEKVREIVPPKPGWTLVQSRDRNIAGWLSPYNSRLKVYLYLAAQGFIRARSPYTAVYYEAKEKYMNRTDWFTNEATGKAVMGAKGHANAAATRKMVKVFLSHLWNQWRELEGLSTRPPYVIDKLGHTTEYTRAEFGWPEIKTAETK
jgi:hypothetical protein